MIRRQRTRHGNPARFDRWIGAAGALVAGVFLYVSFVANNGVPGTPSYEVSVDVPNANRMIPGNQVRIGGVRVGQVTRVEAIPAGDGADARPASRLRLRLSTDLRPLRGDTRVRIRPASVLGATYVELTPGRAGRALPEGAVLPVAQARDGVELTDLLDMFDRRTSQGIQTTLSEVGGGLAGRGSGLGRSITNLERLADPVRRLSRTLAADRTQLGPLIAGYQATLEAVARAGAELDGLVGDGATTFGALNASSTGLRETFRRAPGAATAATGALASLRPALRDLTTLSADLRPAARRLPGTLSILNATLTAGRPAARKVATLDTPLTTTFSRLRGLAARPSTEGALRKGGELSTVAEQILEVLTPAQTQCNLLSVWGENLYTAFGTMGSEQGATYGPLLISQLGTNIGETVQNAVPHRDLHVNYLPNVGRDECEAGNEPFTPGRRSLSNPPGLQADSTVPTTPPAGVQRLAREAGLLDTPPGG
ncbi:MlaD family protein [Patulibacter brassicae]|uniref:MlaD family protein n=1 Tax=Patulibacter brassicae TaxID=1705717 RepID=A0ABU4VQP7_9ACTN|nr:MlaD family protein [Patulibacter brassicae]MDX8153256.1 MlaD family protein [Patulibacter brassicae]